MALKSPRRGVQSIRRHHSAALGSFPSRSFYVDATLGNDANSGTYPDEAWQTIGKVNGESFLLGDRILFKRGETWAGAYLTLPLWAFSDPSVTLGAYGVGADPLINGFVPWWTPEDHGNLVEWWDARDLSEADGSEVTTWTGKSANAASQVGVGLKPTLQKTAWVGLPVVRFDGSDDYLITTVDPPTPAGTIFIVYRPRVTATAWYGFCNDGAGNNCNLRRLANKDTWYLGTKGAVCTTRFGQGDYTTHVVAIVYSAGEQKLRANGYEEYSDVPAGSIPTIPMYIGGVNNNDGGVYGYGAIDVAHILVFNTNLNAATCQQIESYLARQVYLPLHSDVWFARHWQHTLDEWYVGQPPPPSEVTVGLVGAGSEILTRYFQHDQVLVAHVPEMDGVDARATVARSHEFEDSSRTDLFFSFRFKYQALPTNSTDWGPMITQYKSVAPSDPLYFLSWRWPWTGTLGLFRDVFVPPAAGAWMAPAAAVPVPVADEWMHCEMRYNWNAVGDVQVWLDGVLIWNVAGVDTRHNAGGATGNFGVGLYGSGIAPADMTMYIKDVHISESQLGP